MMKKELAKFLDCMSDFVIVTNCNGVAIFVNDSCQAFAAAYQIEILNCVFRPAVDGQGEGAAGSHHPVFLSLDWSSHTGLGDQLILHISRPVRAQGTGRHMAPRDNRSNMQFISTISHEMRTPLNGILGMTRLLRDGGIDTFQSTCIDTINDAGNALLLLVNDILDYSKLGSRMRELSEKTFSPALLIQGAAELLSPKAMDKGLEFGYYITPSIPSIVKGDEGRLRQILINLISNAIKFTEKGGVIIDARADLHPDDQTAILRISVIDTGIGIADKEHETIFEEFYQADHRAREKIEGTGLGLTITRSLARMMGGEVSLQSIEGQGSRFTTTVRLGTEEAYPPHRPVLHFNGSAPIVTLTRSPVLKTLLDGQLCNLGVRKRLFATDLDAALEFLHKNRGAILLCDSFEAKEHGADLAAAAAYAIVLLSTPDRNRIDDLRACGFDGYLSKPIREESLGRRLAACLDAARSIDRIFDKDEGAIVNADVLPDTTARPNAQTGPDMAEAQDDLAHKNAAPQGCRVLLAEDNRINTILAKAIIERAGFDLDIVKNGEEAVKAVREKLYDIVLMDMHMPVMNGIEAAGAIRKLDGAASETPIIALTANAMQSDHTNCLNAGMSAFLSKPFEPESLIRLIKKWQRRQNLKAPPAHGTTGEAVDRAVRGMSQ